MRYKIAILTLIILCLGTYFLTRKLEAPLPTPTYEIQTSKPVDVPPVNKTWDNDTNIKGS